MRETYTAVYVRDGDAWLVEIAEEPEVRSRGLSMVEARENIRKVLAQRLKVESDQLRIMDHFRLPSEIRAAQEIVKATRTEDERSKMMASMTDAKPAMTWAEELGISLRDPVTVQRLESLGDREVSIDTFCHTITMVEEIAMLADER